MAFLGQKAAKRKRKKQEPAVFLTRWVSRKELEKMYPTRKKK